MTRQISEIQQHTSLHGVISIKAVSNRRLTVLVALVCLSLFWMPSGTAEDEPKVFGANPMNVEEDGQRELVLHFPWKFQLPAVVRYRELPQRMLSEPMLQEAEYLPKLPGQFPETWMTCFTTSDDLEIRVVALEHLARIARLNQTDLSPVADQLIKTLKETTNRQLFWGCLCAIRDGNLKQASDVLLNLAKTSNDDTLRIVDPLLASWEFTPAIATWQKRLEDSTSTTTGRLLACRALVEIDSQEAAQSLSQIVADKSAPFQLRQAAAIALCKLDQAAARSLAANRAPSSLRERLLQVELLDHNHADAMQAMMGYCDDQNSAVALAAWEGVESHDPNRLLPKLVDALKHNESGIRKCCTRLVAEFPTEERIQALMPLMADTHIEVRNACRTALSNIGAANPKFEQPIVNQLAQIMNTETAPWESVEQTCYVLAALKRPEFAEACLKRCRNERQEVYIAAAWLYHLMPEPKLNKELKDVVEERIQRMTSGDHASELDDLDRQVGFLFQAVGYSQQVELLNTMIKQLDKASGLGEQGRGAGVWAIGALRANSKDVALSAKVIGTMNDRVSPLEPEYDSVRRMAAQSVGRIAAESSIPVLQAAFPEDPANTGIPQTVRWALQIMGQPSPGDIKPFHESISGWKLQPMTYSR